MPDVPLTADAPGAGRRLSVVFVSHFIPWPPIGGAFQRSFHLLRRVARLHDVHLVAVRHKRTVYKGYSVHEALDALKKECASVRIVDLSRRTTPLGLLLGAAASLVQGRAMSVRLYDDPTLRQTIRAAVAEKQADVLHLDTIGLAQYVNLAGCAGAVLGHQNVESLMTRRRVAYERNPAARAFFRYEAGALLRNEREMCPRFDANLVVSREEGEALRTATGVRTFDVIANGVDVEAFQPVRRHPGSKTLIFAGRLDQYANRDAILHFVRTCWPVILAQQPQARLLIVGANPPADVRALADGTSGIEVTGFVDDVRPYFERAAATVNPLRDGGGTRLKVLDALALGMPIVSTTFGVGGLDLAPEVEVLIADSPEAFASQVSRLLSDPALQERLAVSARRVAEERFDWDRLAAHLSSVYVRVAPPPAASVSAPTSASRIAARVDRSTASVPGALR